MQGVWSTEWLAGKRADILEPAGGRRPRFGAIFLHDLAGQTLADRPVFTGFLQEMNIACVCPWGGPAWWTDVVCKDYDNRQTAERHVLDDILPWMQARWNLAPRGIGIFGVSMGGQGALRLAFRHPKLFPVVAAIAPALDYHELYGQGLSLDDMYTSKEHCRQDTVLLHVPPYDAPPHIFFCIDPADKLFFRGADRLVEKLNALGVEHTADLATTGGGHTWEYFERMAQPAMRFLYNGLEHESRRLL